MRFGKMKYSSEAISNAIKFREIKFLDTYLAFAFGNELGALQDSAVEVIIDELF
jgi:hypothetical protein